MKLKDIERTAHVAWSPKTQHPLYLAAGTAASQLDASFNTNAALELYSLNIDEPGPDTQLIASVASEHRFHKVIWSPAGTDPAAGTIIGGCEDGWIQIYSASKLIKHETAAALVGKQQKHSGPVHAVDFNIYQPNLFASGAGESEIFIWDLNNTSSPMSPGTKSQPLEDVLSVAWNRKVEHILASSFASKCVVWDLRKNEQVIKVTDTVARIRWKTMAWHPEQALQLCLASEDDHSPVIQLWDLRFATSPLKTLENHQRGVLAICWCDQDADLLISCGKDDRILCWNPNSNHASGEVLSEIAKTNQWSFDVVWSNRNPALIASPNYDGHVSIYSIMGGKTGQQIQTSNKIADSFPGMDGYDHIVPAQQQHQSHVIVSADPAKPPKWFRKPVGASFGFGGKLISFHNDKQQSPHDVSRTVQISQVVTEMELVQKSSELEVALESGNFVEYCLNKANETTDQHKKYIWHFLKANFKQNPRAELLNLLGYSIEDINSKLNQHIGKRLLQNNAVDQRLTDQFSGNRIEDYEEEQEEEDPLNNISNGGSSSKSPPPPTPFRIKTNDDSDGLITQALLLNNVEAAVELCFKAEKYADALIIATTGGPDLLARTQQLYLDKSTNSHVSHLISAMISDDWHSVITTCDIANWKEALAATLTHASEDDLPILCEQLGSRLQEESNTLARFAKDAQLCYICSGNFDRLVTSWSDGNSYSTRELQELVELVAFLQKAIERQGKHVQISGALADLLSQYASLLAAQGNLQTALSYLGTSSQNPKVVSLRDRLLTALGEKPLNVQELRQYQHTGTSSRRGSARTSLSGYSSVFTTTATLHQPQATPLTAPPPPNCNFTTGGPKQLPAAAVPPSAWGQTWQAAPPASPVPPPRPDSVGSSARGGGGPLARKYICDPSVSNPSYPPATNHYSTQSHHPSSSHMFQPTSALETVPDAMLSQLPPVEQGQSALSYQAEAPPGWNDPPPVLLGRPAKQHTKPNHLVATDPITHPIFGSAPHERINNNNGGNNYYGAAPPPVQYQQPLANFGETQMFIPAAPTHPYQSQAEAFNPTSFNQNCIGEAVTAQAPSLAPTIPEPRQKPPIPTEHANLQNVFDDLKARCHCAANNPQTKRKLEDVGRRLETLYDSLRFNKLSSTAVTALHQIAQYVHKGDYMNGLQLHTQLVQGPDFAQIANFMPGIKVLIQLALQLHVYLN